MLEAEYNNCSLLGSSRVDQLQTVANRTGIALIGMKKILRPVLGLFAVVAERSDDLKLNLPLVWNQ